jgi:hypothetical protein
MVEEAESSGAVGGLGASVPMVVVKGLARDGETFHVRRGLDTRSSVVGRFHMRAVLCKRLDGPQALVIEDMPTEEPGPGETP